MSSSLLLVSRLDDDDNNNDTTTTARATTTTTNETAIVVDSFHQAMSRYHLLAAMQEDPLHKKRRRRQRRRSRMVLGGATGLIVGTLVLGPIGGVAIGVVGVVLSRTASKIGEKRKDIRVQREWERWQASERQSWDSHNLRSSGGDDATTTTSTAATAAADVVIPPIQHIPEAYGFADDNVIDNNEPRGTRRRIFGHGVRHVQSRSTQ
jgi:hypothetical protein